MDRYVERILADLKLAGGVKKEHFVSNQSESEAVDAHGTKIVVRFTRYKDDDIEAEVSFRLPEDSVTANTFMDHCAAKEGTKKNNYGEYCYGPAYRDQRSENFNKHTFAYVPGSDHYFYVASKYYKLSEADEAIANVVALSRQFVSHLSELGGLRVWKTDDKEVVEKEKEIVANADLVETDVDREERAHWLRDRNSFFKGWFMPFNCNGEGSFDILWPGSVDFVARNMGNRGSFEYAVACRLLENSEYIAKARKACIIREDTIRRRY